MMSIHRLPLQVISKSLYLFLFACLYPIASQALTIAQQPIYLQGGEARDPNIMFTFDDSGSMRRYYLSNGQIDRDHIIPEDQSPYDYNVNTLYYNPKVTYTAWDNYTGGLKADSTKSKESDRTTENISNKVNFPTLTESTIDCNRLQLTNTGNKPSKPTRPTGTAKSPYPENSISAEQEDTYYTALRKFYGEGYQCFYYENTQLAAKNDETYIHGEYMGGTLVPIASSVATNYVRQNRLDCANHQLCTYEEESRNYINWLLYYSSRIKVAKGSIGTAFTQLDNKVRVGIGKINSTTTGIDGSAKGTVLIGVRKFQDQAKTDFFSTLYGFQHNGGTPMRRAFDDVGQYFMLDKPWFDDPAQSSQSVDTCSTCRQSFHIVMTDGYWKDDEATTGAARENVDGSNGEYITNDSGGAQTRYVATRPYSDTSANTLSDVATYYWKNDLKPNIKNKIATSSDDPAYWQHLPIFAIGFGVNGSFAQTKANLDAITAEKLFWPQITADDKQLEIPKKLDDLWHATVNTRGNFFNVKNISEFVTALTDAFAQIQSRVGSSAAIASNSTRLYDNTAIYQAKYNTANWTGDLTAYEIDVNTHDVGDALWVASSHLPSAASRTIYTLEGEFLWDDLNNTQKNSLKTKADNTTGDDTYGQSVLNWIRGVQSNEAKNGGSFRNRTSLLGDIVNSGPVLVSNQYYGYGDSTFTATKATRTPMVYVGANDGMLHGFDANTGVEKFAYIPQGIFSKLPARLATDYVSNHQYFVDGSLKVGDALLGNGQGSWKTVLLGSTGAGGKSVFALDVTNPAYFGDSTVMWEYNSDNTQNDMGYTIPQSTFSLLSGNSKWSAIIANGYNSTSNQAKLILLDLNDGSVIQTISTGEGDATNPNGLSSPIPVDINSDRKVDYIYAGDLRGNLWRFDVTDNQKKNWAAKKIFTACSSDTCSDSNRQPITVRPEVVKHNAGGVLVLFGTGSDFATEDRSSTQVQAMYAVRDTLEATPTLLHRTDLVAQTITEPTINGVKYRVVSQEDVNYESKHGWYLNVISPTAASGTGERIVNNFSIDSDKVIFTTTIPSTDPCDYGGKSWLMELSLMTGKRLTYSVFDSNSDDKIDDSDNYNDNDNDNDNPLSGRGYDDVINTPTIIKDGSTSNDGADETKFISSSSGAIHKVREKGSSSTGGRQSWQQLR